MSDMSCRGQFDIQGGGRLPTSCDGIQAHVSTCASAKVLEVVRKLPQKIILEEVPRSNNWPMQFLENYATEDNIALYFFASDVERSIKASSCDFSALFRADGLLKYSYVSYAAMKETTKICLIA